MLEVCALINHNSNDINAKQALLDKLFNKNNSNILQSQNININHLIPFTENIFRLYSGERFNDMVQSIKAYGILVPLLVRPINSTTCEILAGHNRWNCAKHIGLSEIPVIKLTGLSDYRARIIVIESNLLQRSMADLSHSEKAFVLSEYYNILKKVGNKEYFTNEVDQYLNSELVSSENIVSPMETEGSSYRKIADKYSLSKDTVARYIKISTLDMALLTLIDSGDISIRAGVNLSYLSTTNQKCLSDLLTNNQIKLDAKMARELRRLQDTNELDPDILKEFLKSNMEKQSFVVKDFTLSERILKKYFSDNQTTTEIEKIIQKALAQYFKNERKAGEV